MNVRMVATAIIVVAVLALSSCSNNNESPSPIHSTQITTTSPAPEYTYLPGLAPNLVLGFLCQSEPQVTTSLLVDAGWTHIKNAVEVGEPHYDEATGLCTVDMTFYGEVAVVALYASFPALASNMSQPATTTLAVYTWESVWMQTDVLPDGRAWSDAEVEEKDRSMQRILSEAVHA